MAPRCKFDNQATQLLTAFLSHYNHNVTRIASPTYTAVLTLSKNVRHLSSIHAKTVARCGSLSQTRLLSSGSGHAKPTLRSLEKSESRRSSDSKKEVENSKSSPSSKVSNLEEGQQRRKRPAWAIYKEALKKKFPEGWNPRKKVSPDAMEGIRALHAQYPEECTREVLANQFKISQEAVRRILKAKPSRVSEAQAVGVRERWAKRHDQIWDNMTQLGLRPPRQRSRSADDNTFTVPSFERSA